MAIDIGAGTGDYNISSGAATDLDLTNPANATGILNVFKIWGESGHGDMTGVKIGTFYGSSTTYTYRDHEAIGNVTAGSEQTFSGLNCDVVLGDVIGHYAASGAIEVNNSGGSGVVEKSGSDYLAAGTHNDYDNISYIGYKLALYGTGIEANPPYNRPIIICPILAQ
jgi:hypothetical protein